jgi:hypothetical protein
MHDLAVARKTAVRPLREAQLSAYENANLAHTHPGRHHSGAAPVICFIDIKDLKLQKHCDNCRRAAKSGIVEGRLSVGIASSRQLEEALDRTMGSRTATEAQECVDSSRGQSNGSGMPQRYAEYKKTVSKRKSTRLI